MRACSETLNLGLERVTFNEVPPRVEHNVTQFGTKFIRILDGIDRLQIEIKNEI